MTLESPMQQNKANKPEFATAKWKHAHTCPLETQETLKFKRCYL